MYFDGIWINIFHIYQPPKWPKKIIDKVARESYFPFTTFLIKNPTIKITLNCTGSLTEQLRKHNHTKILTNIQTLAKRGQIELMTTGALHPIFPLISDILRDISLSENERLNKNIFKENPSGCWLPELAYASSVEPVLKRHNVSWIITDEIATSVKNASKVGHGWKTKQGLNVLFRHPEASDYFFKTFNKKTATPIKKHISKKNSLFPLVTATDGENLGHHNPPMLHEWSRLVLKKNVHTLTVSELIAMFLSTKTITLRSASWADTKKNIQASNPFILWNNKNNSIHRAQWQLTRLATQHAHKKGDYALLSLSKILYSDQYWWASDMPWWDKEVIIKGAQKFNTFIKKEGTYNEKVVAEKLMKKIISLTNRHTIERTKQKKNIMFGGELV